MNRSVRYPKAGAMEVFIGNRPRRGLRSLPRVCHRARCFVPPSLGFAVKKTHKQLPTHFCAKLSYSSKSRQIPVFLRCAAHFTSQGQGRAIAGAIARRMNPDIGDVVGGLSLKKTAASRGAHCSRLRQNAFSTVIMIQICFMLVE